MTQAARQEAEKRFLSLSTPENLPSWKNENFRYTSLRNIDLDRNPEKKENLDPVPEDFLRVDESDLGLIVLRAGTDLITQAGEELGGLKVERPSSDDMPKVFSSDVFCNLVLSRWQTGLALTVPSGFRSEKVLRILSYLDPTVQNMIQRLIIRVEEGAEINIVHECRGAGQLNGKAPLVANFVELSSDANAQVRYFELQNWGPNVEFFSRQILEAEKDSKISYSSLALGGLKSQNRWESRCNGKGAQVSFNGAAFGNGSQHYDLWVTARHDVPDTTSDLNYRTVLKDRGRAVFNGNIIISEKGLRTSADQQNRNLLLSDTAVVDTIPKLEIATDDVKCAHGATTSPIDENQIFYLESRGIPRSDAERMIIEGFSASVFESLPSDSLRQRLLNELRSKI